MAKVKRVDVFDFELHIDEDEFSNLMRIAETRSAIIEDVISDIIEEAIDEIVNQLELEE